MQSCCIVVVVELLMQSCCRVVVGGVDMHKMDDRPFFDYAAMCCYLLLYATICTKWTIVHFLIMLLYAAICYCMLL